VTLTKFPSLGVLCHPFPDQDHIWHEIVDPWYSNFTVIREYCGPYGANDRNRKFVWTLLADLGLIWNARVH